MEVDKLWEETGVSPPFTVSIRTYIRVRTYVQYRPCTRCFLPSNGTWNNFSIAAGLFALSSSRGSRSSLAETARFNLATVVRLIEINCDRKFQFDTSSWSFLLAYFYRCSTIFSAVSREARAPEKFHFWEIENKESSRYVRMCVYIYVCM